MPEDESPFGSPASGPLLPADAVYRRLHPVIGPNVARMAIRTFAQKTVNAAPEKLSRQDAPKLITGLRPLLRTMLGDAQAERIVQELTEEFAS